MQASDIGSDISNRKIFVVRDIFSLFLASQVGIIDKDASTTFCVDRLPNVDILGSHHFESQLLESDGRLGRFG